MTRTKRAVVVSRTDLRLLSAADGSLGIEFARAHRPDVILMDIHLPGISGVEAMKVLRADPATAHIPIIALSANAVPRDIAAGLIHGVGTSHQSCSTPVARCGACMAV